MIQARCVAQTNGIGSGEQPEEGIWMNNLVAVEQGQLAIDFQNALDYKHHICAPGIIFVKDQCHGILKSPWQNALTEFCHLLAITQHNCILADQIDSADMAIEVDPDTGPVQPCGNLFDMC